MNLTDAKHIEFFRSLPIFRELDNKELKSVIDHLYTKEVAENEMVFARLEREKILYIVRFGSLELELIGREDKIYEKGDVFGEVALFNNNFRTGTIKATSPSLLVCLNGADLVNPEKINSSIALKLIMSLANTVTSYLTTSENTSTYKLIEQGENDHVEFKSTLRYNLYTKKFDKEIEHAALKTIAAFMNSSGGSLIVGVDDNKNILGLENDNFKDHDRMLLHLTKLIQERIGMQHTQFIRATIEDNTHLNVLRIDVKPSNTPAYLTHLNDEIFYVRTGPSTTPMRISELYNYIQKRF